MVGICGWSSGVAGHAGDYGNLIEIVNGFGNSVESNENNSIFGQRVALAVGASDDHSGVFQTGSLVSAISGVYHWQDKNISSLRGTRNPAEVLIAAYRKYGDDLPGRLSGSYSFAIADDDTGRVLLAVDQFCSKQLAYFDVGGSFVFASNTNGLRRHPLCPSSIDPNAIFAYLFFHNVPLPYSVFQGISRMPPGHRLTWDTKTVDSRKFSELSFDDANGVRNSSELTEEIMRLLGDEVVRCSLGAETGTFLSGGLDSSTITGLLTRSAGQCASFSIGFDAKNYDEMLFARNVSKYFETTHHEYYVTPQDIIDAVPDIAKSDAEPFGNASAVPTYYCAKLAKENGIQRLLGGDGGDELFGGNERYAYDKLFSFYNRSPKKMQGLLERIFSPDLEDTPRLFRKASNYIAKAKTPLPDRLFLDTLLLSLGPSTILDPAFLESVNEQLPLELIRSQYNSVSQASDLNRHLALDWYFTLACSDLPKVTNMSELAGISVAYPFLGRSVVEFSTHLPDKFKVNGFKLRYFFKKAVHDFLPDMTIHKSKHGFGLPFGVWLMENAELRDFAFDNLASLKRREIVQPNAIDNLIGHLLPMHPQYYGVMVWVLMMLEQFYELHSDNVGG